MVKRAAARRDLLWLCVLVPAVLLVLSPEEQTTSHLVSTAALLPALFLIPGWTDSKSRAGLISLLFRTDSYTGIRISEILLPALSGAVLTSGMALLVKHSIPWQFWLAGPLTAMSFTLILTVTEGRMKYPGRVFLSLLWIYGTSRPEGLGKTGGTLVLTEYPGGVLSAIPDSGGLHPDSYIIASLVLALLCAGIYSLTAREE